MTLMLAGTLAATVGCSSKNYVRQQTTPLINKTNELDDMTAKNSKDIKDVDQRAQAGIQAAQARAAEVDQKAVAAGKQADDAQTLANNATQRVDNLTNAVVNLDNYRSVADTSVLFGFNRDNLTKEGKEELDQHFAGRHVFRRLLIGCQSSRYFHPIHADVNVSGAGDFKFLKTWHRADTDYDFFRNFARSFAEFASELEGDRQGILAKLNFRRLLDDDVHRVKTIGALQKSAH